MNRPEFTNDSDEMADVSVIVPAYNAKNTIGRALASIARQTIRPREVIVVIDGHDDDIRQAALGASDLLGGTELKIFEQDHAGAGAARNRAIREASSDIVAFLDADDEWLPEKLARSLPYMAPDDIVLVSHNVRIVDHEKITDIDCAKHFDANSSNQFASVYRRGFISNSTVLARRRAVIDAGGFDAGLANAQDFDLWLSMIKRAGARFHVFGETLTQYHVTESSIMSNTGRRLDCCLEIARRYLPELKGRSNSVMAAIWFRIAAIHQEALSAYLGKRNFTAAVSVCFSLPIQISKFTFLALSQIDDENGQAREKPGFALPLFLWGWIVAGTIAYLFQFRPLAGSALRALGIT